VIGCLYIGSPERILGGFGLKPPAADADTRAWLRLKGNRDIASGVAVLTLMLTTDISSSSLTERSILIGLMLLLALKVAFDIVIKRREGAAQVRGIGEEGKRLNLLHQIVERQRS
jgi:hypothetical protein